MIRIGITGQHGFIGWHLYNFLKLQENVSLVAFDRSYFDNAVLLQHFVSNCDVIVHLAALNRHTDPSVIYKTNIQLGKQLVTALEAAEVAPHLIFSSSIQEEQDNKYGLSKREGRDHFADWAQKSGAVFTGLIIPNVFGPFCHAHYNSVVATFCHQLTHHQTPSIEVDGLLQLIYIDELVEVIWRKINAKRKEFFCKVVPTKALKVSQLLQQLQLFKASYFEKGNIPFLSTAFDIQLFNTFRSYIRLQHFFPFLLHKNADHRGSFVETMRLAIGGQVSFSTTNPGFTRGNHFHSRKIERFVVLKGKAIISMRKIGDSESLHFHLDGDKPSFVDMPIWYTHSITNVGQDELYTLFWINEFFDASDADTYFETVESATLKV